MVGYDIRLSCLAAIWTLEAGGIVGVRALSRGVGDIRADAALVAFVVALSCEVVKAGARTANFDRAVVASADPASANCELRLLMDRVTEFRRTLHVCSALFASTNDNLVFEFFDGM